MGKSIDYDIDCCEGAINGVICPIREKCVRYNTYQSAVNNGYPMFLYFVKPSFEKEKVNCKYFMLWE